MYPYNIDPREYVRQALALQPQVAPSFPQMTPASQSYFGPTHQALSDTLRAALAQQASNAGLFASPTPEQMGLLSPATTMPMANSFFRMDPSFAKPIYVAPNTTTVSAASPTQFASNDSSSRGEHYLDPYAINTSQNSPNDSNAIGNNLGTYSLGLPADNPHVNPVTGLMNGVGNIFSGIFGAFQNPTSIDAPGADTKTAAEVSAPTYRLSSNDLMDGIGPQPSITGTPLGNLSNDLTGEYSPTERITGTPLADLSGPNLNGYSPDPYAGMYGRGLPNTGLPVEHFPGDNLSYTKDQTQLPSADEYNDGMGVGLGGAGEVDDSGDSRGGPITKKKLFGKKPNNGDDGWGTLKDGEYVIRPESVKVLPPGLLSALNTIYKSPNPKKTLRGLLG
jgi:hypothetical protein